MPTGVRLLFQKLRDGGDDGILLLALELGIDGNADTLPGQPFTDRQRRRGAVVWCEALLQVHGAGVIDFGSDLTGGEKTLECIAEVGTIRRGRFRPRKDTERVLIPNVLVA